MTWKENIAADFGWIYDWQTLIGALFATAAAIITVIVMHQQNLEARQREAEASQRKALAARARMPNALRDLIDFCEQCTANILNEDKRLPDEPTAALEDLKLAIEYIDLEKAEQLFELLSHYQVVTSRYYGYHNFLPEKGLYDLAKLHHYTSRLFSYARGRDSKYEESEGKLLKNSLNAMVSLTTRIDEKDILDEARKIIERHHPV